MSIDIYKGIAKTAMKVRAETQATDVDILLGNGTVFRQNGDSAKMLAELDEIIAVQKRRRPICQA